MKSKNSFTGRYLGERMSDPLVSVCIPTYNRAHYLKESLASIIAQRYASLEILISDNSSTDKTQDVCRTFERQDVRVRYFRQNANIGMHANHNFLIEKSRGEFICFFHDDDLYEADIIQRYVEFFRNNPEAGIVCSDWELIDGSGKAVGLRRNKVKMVSSGMEYIRHTLVSGRSSVCCSGALIRRKALDQIRFDPNGTIGFSDFLVWFQISEKYYVGHIPAVLFRYRIHQAGYSSRKILSITRDYSSTLLQFCDGHLKRFPDHGKLVDTFRQLIRGNLFWALAYEVGLKFSDGGRTRAPGRKDKRTVFEISRYELSEDEIKELLVKMSLYQRGLLQRCVLVVIKGALACKMGRILGWCTRYTDFLRSLMVLR